MYGRSEGPRGSNSGNSNNSAINTRMGNLEFPESSNADEQQGLAQHSYRVADTSLFWKKLDSCDASISHHSTHRYMPHAVTFGASMHDPTASSTIQQDLNAQSAQNLGFSDTSAEVISTVGQEQNSGSILDTLTDFSDHHNGGYDLFGSKNNDANGFFAKFYNGSSRATSENSEIPTDVVTNHLLPTSRETSHVIPANQQDTAMQLQSRGESQQHQGSSSPNPMTRSSRAPGSTKKTKEARSSTNRGQQQRTSTSVDARSTPPVILQLENAKSPERNVTSDTGAIPKRKRETNSQNAAQNHAMAPLMSMLSGLQSKADKLSGMLESLKQRNEKYELKIKALKDQLNAGASDPEDTTEHMELAVLERSSPAKTSPTEVTDQQIQLRAQEILGDGPLITENMTKRISEYTECALKNCNIRQQKVMQISREVTKKARTDIQPTLQNISLLTTQLSKQNKETKKLKRQNKKLQDDEKLEDLQSSQRKQELQSSCDKLKQQNDTKRKLIEEMRNSLKDVRPESCKTKTKVNETAQDKVDRANQDKNKTQLPRSKKSKAPLQKDPLLVGIELVEFVAKKLDIPAEREKPDIQKRQKLIEIFSAADTPDIVARILNDPEFRDDFASSNIDEEADSLIDKLQLTVQKRQAIEAQREKIEEKVASKYSIGADNWKPTDPTEPTVALSPGIINKGQACNVNSDMLIKYWNARRLALSIEAREDESNPTYEACSIPDILHTILHFYEHLPGEPFLIRSIKQQIFAALKSCDHISELNDQVQILYKAISKISSNVAEAQFAFVEKAETKERTIQEKTAEAERALGVKARLDLIGRLMGEIGKYEQQCRKTEEVNLSLGMQIMEASKAQASYEAQEQEIRSNRAKAIAATQGDFENLKKLERALKKQMSDLSNKTMNKVAELSQLSSRVTSLMDVKMQNNIKLREKRDSIPDDTNASIDDAQQLLEYQNMAETQKAAFEAMAAQGMVLLSENQETSLKQKFSEAHETFLHLQSEVKMMRELTSQLDHKLADSNKNHENITKKLEEAEACNAALISGHDEMQSVIQKLQTKLRSKDLSTIGEENTESDKALAPADEITEHSQQLVQSKASQLSDTTDEISQVLADSFNQQRLLMYSGSLDHSGSSNKRDHTQPDSSSDSNNDDIGRTQDCDMLIPEPSRSSQNYSQESAKLGCYQAACVVPAETDEKKSGNDAKISSILHNLQYGAAVTTPESVDEEQKASKAVRFPSLYQGSSSSQEDQQATGRKKIEPIPVDNSTGQKYAKITVLKRKTQKSPKVDEPKAEDQVDYNAIVNIKSAISTHENSIQSLQSNIANATEKGENYQLTIKQLEKQNRERIKKRKLVAGKSQSFDEYKKHEDSQKSNDANICQSLSKHLTKCINNAHKNKREFKQHEDTIAQFTRQLEIETRALEICVSKLNSEIEELRTGILSIRNENVAIEERKIAKNTISRQEILALESEYNSLLDENRTLTQELEAITGDLHDAKRSTDEEEEEEEEDLNEKIDVAPSEVVEIQKVAPNPYANMDIEEFEKDMQGMLSEVLDIHVQAMSHETKRFFDISNPRYCDVLSDSSSHYESAHSSGDESEDDVFHTASCSSGQLSETNLTKVWLVPGFGFDKDSVHLNALLDNEELIKLSEMVNLFKNFKESITREIPKAASQNETCDTAGNGATVLDLIRITCIMYDIYTITSAGSPGRDSILEILKEELRILQEELAETEACQKGLIELARFKRNIVAGFYAYQISVNKTVRSRLQSCEKTDNPETIKQLAKNKLVATEDTITKLKIQVESAKRRAEDMQAANERLKKEHRQKNRAVQVASMSLAAATRNNDTMKTKKDSTSGKISEDVTALREGNATLTSVISNQKGYLEILRNDIDEKDKCIQRLEREIGAQRDELKKIAANHERTNQLRMERKEKGAVLLNSAHERAKEYSNKCVNIKRQIELKKKLQLTQESIDTLKSEALQMSDITNNAQRHVAKMQKQHQKFAEELLEARQRHKTLQKRDVTLQQSVMALQKKLEDADNPSRIDQLARKKIIASSTEKESILDLAESVEKLTMDSFKSGEASATNLHEKESTISPSEKATIGSSMDDGDRLEHPQQLVNVKAALVIVDETKAGAQNLSIYP